MRGLFSEISGIPLFLWTIGRCWSKEISPSNKENFCWKKKKWPLISLHLFWLSGEPQITTGSHMSGSYYVLGGQGPGNSWSCLFSAQVGAKELCVWINLKELLMGQVPPSMGLGQRRVGGLGESLALIFWTIYRLSSFQVQRVYQGPGNSIWICAMCYGEPGNSSRDTVVDRELLCYLFVFGCIGS